MSKKAAERCNGDREASYATHLSRGVGIDNAMKRTSLLRWMTIRTVKARRQLLTFTGCPRCRRIFHSQSPFLNVPSNPSALNFPTRGCRPIVALKEPSPRTVPLMFGASLAN